MSKGDSTRFSEVTSGNPTSTCIPRVDVVVNGPPGLGRHIPNSHPYSISLQITNNNSNLSGFYNNRFSLDSNHFGNKLSF